MFAKKREEGLQVKRSLMIAEGNPAQCNALEAVFSPLEKIELLPSARNCSEALAALSGSHRPEILLLDLMLPGGDGFTVLDAIDQLPQEKRPLVFLMTAMSHERLLLAVQNRVVFCFIKPFLPERAVLRVLQLACEPEKATVPQKNTSNLVKIGETLLSLNVPAHLRGYHYLRDAVRIYVETEHPLKLRITRDVYPMIAKEHGDSVAGVENAIRTAVDFAWTHGNLQRLHDMFGYTVSEKHGKPGNAEFVTMVAEHIRLGVTR